jgi:hypothetical protein
MSNRKVTAGVLSTGCRTLASLAGGVAFDTIACGAISLRTPEDQGIPAQADNRGVAFGWLPVQVATLPGVISH